MSSTEHDFWRDFVEDYWESGPVLLSGERAQFFPQIPQHELFCAVVACIDDFLQGNSQKVRFYANDAEVDLLRAGHRLYLPTMEDGSFEEYDQRIRHKHQLEDYALIIADWHAFDRSLWEHIVSSVQLLSKHVGICASRMDTQLFLGNYKVTPFGVHVDPTSAFHVPVVGKKVMRFWENSFVASQPALPHARDYSRFAEEGLQLSAFPGDIIYWPSDYWHVGEGQDEFSVTWRFAYWMADGMHQSAVDTMASLVDSIDASQQMTHFPTIHKPIDVETHFVDAQVDELMSLASSELLRARLTRSWLERYSAYGFLRRPPLRSIEHIHITAETCISRLPLFPLFLRKVSEDAVCIAAAGYSLLFRPFPLIIRAVERMNKEESMTFADLCIQGVHVEALHRLVEFCYQSGAIQITNTAKETVSKTVTTEHFY